MNTRRLFVASTAVAVALMGARTARAATPPGASSSGRCPALRAEAMTALERALSSHLSRDAEHWPRFLDFHHYIDLDADRLCVEGPRGTWAILFDEKKSSFARAPNPINEHLFVPWRLVHFDGAGVRHDSAGFNPFAAKVSNMPVHARERSATLGFDKVVPQLIAGDFDGSGREQVIVMNRWARGLKDYGGLPNPEAGAADQWPMEKTLGRAFVFEHGAIRPTAGTEGLWVVSAERCPQTGEWVIGTYGRFFRFEAASPREDGEEAYPVHGPLFRLFPASGGGLTMDDPRQLAHLRRACEEASRVCETFMPPENVAIIEAVCERVPGAPSLAAQRMCTGAFNGAQARRPPGWLERWRRTPVNGVSLGKRSAQSGDGCECSVSPAASNVSPGPTGPVCTTAPRCGRYVVEDPGNGAANSGTGLVNDTTSGLRWLRFGSPWFTGHEEAVAYCAGRGMRLPTREEALRITAGRFCYDAWPFDWRTWTSTAASEGRVWVVLFDGRDWEESRVAPYSYTLALCVE